MLHTQSIYLDIYFCIFVKLNINEQRLWDNGINYSVQSTSPGNVLSNVNKGESKRKTGD